MTKTTTTRPRRRGARSASAGQRLRRLISFLSRNRLYRTAHTVERKTCVFFDAAHLRRMMLRDRWAAASSYALSFVNYRDCSREARELNYRILALRVLTAFAAGQARSVETLFRRIYGFLRFKPDRERIAIGRLLLAMRSDGTKSSRLYGRFKPRAMQGIVDLAAKCPELKSKTRLPAICLLVILSHGEILLRIIIKEIKLPVFRHESSLVPFCQKGLLRLVTRRLATRRIFQLTRQQPKERKLKSSWRQRLLPPILSFASHVSVGPTHNTWAQSGLRECPGASGGNSSAYEVAADGGELNLRCNGFCKLHYRTR